MSICNAFLLLVLTSTALASEPRVRLITELQELEWMIGEYCQFANTDAMYESIDELKVTASPDGTKLLVRYEAYAEKDVFPDMVGREEISWDAKLKAIVSTYEVKTLRQGSDFEAEEVSGRYTLKQSAKDKRKWFGSFSKRHQQTGNVSLELFRATDGMRIRISSDDGGNRKKRWYAFTRKGDEKNEGGS